MSYRKIIANDKNLIPYRRELNKISGSPLGTIFLSQVMYWSGISQDKPFYKFLQPCNHPFYNEGDSWEEELGFSKKRITKILSEIGCRKLIIKKGEELTETKKKEIKEWRIKKSTALIWYWTTGSRVPYYQLNTQALDEALLELYKDQDKTYVTKGNLAELPKVFQLSDERELIYTETTTKTTSGEDTLPLSGNPPTQSTSQSDNQPMNTSDNKVKLISDIGLNITLSDKKKYPFNYLCNNILSDNLHYITDTFIKENKITDPILFFKLIFKISKYSYSDKNVSQFYKELKKKVISDTNYDQLTLKGEEFDWEVFKELMGEFDKHRSVEAVG